MKTKTLLGIVIMCLAFCQMVHAQSTELTYQGSLNNGGTPATGNYDFEFLLFDLSSGGSQIGSTLTRNTVAVSAGVFSVKLDFGSQFPGASRFLEIRVRQTGGGGFTTLVPRQAVSSTPYAVKSLTAATSDNTTQLGGVAANQYVLTGDTRLSDERNPSPNSSNYIQNTTNQQAASNFNINGNGTAGGTLSGNIVNAATRYNIDGNRVLSISGVGNLFAGVGAGSNTTGGDNAFFGASAGSSNTTGFLNSFFGASAGQANTTGVANAFFGNRAGLLNTTGNSNSFFGKSAGAVNTTGDDNAFFGADAGISNTTGSGNAFFGNRAGNRNTASFNSFFGNQAGQQNTTGFSNAFFAYGAGFSNTSGDFNSFFGRSAGEANTTGRENAFFGFDSGTSNTTAGFNSFFGPASGRANTIGFANTFAGASSGLLNINGANNSFFGVNSGVVNTSGSLNTFIGRRSANQNTTGSSNTFIGNFAGSVNVDGSNNTIVGATADVGAGNLSFATAIGSGSVVSASNTVVIGRSADTVQIPGTLLSPGTLSANIVSANVQFNIGNNRIVSSIGNNLFLGRNAGLANTTGSLSTFVGSNAGAVNTTGIVNTFVGYDAGLSNTSGNSNSFFGAGAGDSNIDGDDNSVFGAGAGRNVSTGNNNTLVGSSAGQSITTGSGNTLIGTETGGGATGTNNSALGNLSKIGSASLSNATAIGALTEVTQSNSMILGSINGVNGASVDTNVGIGTTAPTARLHVVGDGLFTGNIAVQDIFIENNGGNALNSFRLDGVNNNLNIVARSNPGSNSGARISFRTGTTGAGESTRMIINEAGIVSILSLGAAGGIQLCRNANDEISACSSSARYKSDIREYRQSLNILRQLRPVSFKWTNGGMSDIGLVAEEVAEVEPRLATKNDKGEIEGVKYDRIGVVLINAVREQQTQIETQLKQIGEQRDLIERQRVELDALKQLVCLSNPMATICVAQESKP